jgi:hypothetical protein
MFTEDNDIHSDCLWTITYLTDTENDYVLDFVAQPDLIIRICESMGATDTSLYIPGLRAMGNILTSSDPAVIERCLWHGVVDKLTSLLY